MTTMGEVNTPLEPTALPAEIDELRHARPDQQVLYSVPRFYRSRQQRVLGGVAGGLAEAYGVSTTKVRVALAILGLVNGLGVLVYLGVWAFTPLRPTEAKPTSQARWVDTEDTPTTAPRTPWSTGQKLGAVLVAVSALLLAVILKLVVGVSMGLILGLGCASAGVMWLWRLVDAQRNYRWWRYLPGIVVVLAGVSIMALATEHYGPTVLLLGIVGAVTAVAVPLVRNLLDSLIAERSARARAEERDVIASHLHDSVLQTLALIQKSAEPGSDVQRLARRQERQLRQWLFSDNSTMSAGADTLGAALGIAIDDVEEDFHIAVEPVIVGGSYELDEAATAAVAATREALVNAAKHAGVTQVDLYAEASADDGVEIFIRDRGVGFDVDAIPEDRHGIAQSLRARMQRLDGGVAIESAPGRGTEVHIFTHQPAEHAD